MADTRARSLPLFVVFLAACSGAAATDFFDAVENGGGNPTEPPASSTAGTGNPAPSPSSPPTTAPTTPSTPPDAGVPGDAGDAGPTDSGSSKCTRETEPNDTQATANVFTSTLCGKIDVAGDVDYGRIVAPATATELTWTHAETGGEVRYRFFSNGLALPDLSNLPVLPGTPYAVQIRGAAGGGANRPTYELTVSFK